MGESLNMFFAHIKFDNWLNVATVTVFSLPSTSTISCKKGKRL